MIGVGAVTLYKQENMGIQPHKPFRTLYMYSLSQVVTFSSVIFLYIDVIFIIWT